MEFSSFSSVMKAGLEISKISIRQVGQWSRLALGRKSCLQRKQVYITIAPGGIGHTLPIDLNWAGAHGEYLDRWFCFPFHKIEN